MESSVDDTGVGRIHELIEREHFREAIDLTLPLAQAGGVGAQLILGWLYQVGKGVPKDFDRAKAWYLEAVPSESPRAEFYLGSVYWNESDFPQAVEWFERAASHGFFPAAYQLGRMYRHGAGVQRDPRRAREYVEAAARSGHMFAQRDLAREMARGHRGVLRIPLGLFRCLQVTWRAVRIASRNLEDDRLFRL
jgi:TPR repeat protein